MYNFEKYVHPKGTEKKISGPFFKIWIFEVQFFFLCLLCAPHCLTRTDMRCLDMYLKSYQKRFLMYGFKKNIGGGGHGNLHFQDFFAFFDVMKFPVDFLDVFLH